MSRNITRREFGKFGLGVGATVALGLVGCAQEPAAQSSSVAQAAQQSSSSVEQSASSSAASAPTSSAQLQDQAQSSTTAEAGSSSESSATVASAQFEIPDKQLASGYSMPAFGIGTWTLSDEEAEMSVACALENGYRLVDTAQYYRNEEGVGRAVRAAVEAGRDRESIFVTSKIMPSSYDRAAESIDESLARLDIGYIDLMLIHQPGSNDEEVWRALEDAVNAGKVRSIGISNYYTPEHYDAIANIANVPVSLVQNENHPYYQNAGLKPHVESTGSFVESWYPLGGRPGVDQMLADETLGAVAATYGKTVAQTILRWHVQSGFIAIPGSSNPDHIAENIKIFDFELSEDDMARIASLDGIGRFEIW